jgi:hypothetical protein
MTRSSPLRRPNPGPRRRRRSMRTGRSRQGGGRCRRSTPGEPGAGRVGGDARDGHTLWVSGATTTFRARPAAHLIAGVERGRHAGERWRHGAPPGPVRGVTALPGAAGGAPATIHRRHDAASGRVPDRAPGLPTSAAGVPPIPPDLAMFVTRPLFRATVKRRSLAAQATEPRGTKTSQVPRGLPPRAVPLHKPLPCQPQLGPGPPAPRRIRLRGLPAAARAGRVRPRADAGYFVGQLPPPCSPTSSSRSAPGGSHRCGGCSRYRRDVLDRRARHARCPGRCARLLPELVACRDPAADPPGPSRGRRRAGVGGSADAAAPHSAPRQITV